MTNCIHRQAKTIRETPLAQAQALTETSQVHGLGLCDLLTVALALHVGAGLSRSSCHLFQQLAHRFPLVLAMQTPSSDPECHFAHPSRSENSAIEMVLGMAKWHWKWVFHLDAA